MKKILMLLLSVTLSLGVSMFTFGSNFNFDCDTVWDYLGENDLSYVIVEKDNDIYYYFDLDKYDESLTPGQIYKAAREKYSQNKS